MLNYCPAPRKAIVCLAENVVQLVEALPQKEVKTYRCGKKKAVVAWKWSQRDRKRVPGKPIRPAAAYYGETALPIEWLFQMHAVQGFYHFAQARSMTARTSDSR